MKTHFVKSWSHFYDEILAGNKLHDLRKNDRGYKVGDHMILEKYDNIKGVYLGETQIVEITYITSNVTPYAFSSSVLPNEYCILSIRKIVE